MVQNASRHEAPGDTQRSDILASEDMIPVYGTPPLPRTRLIGREAERARALDQLTSDGAPLLTLTGPGGVGKTRLSLAIAADAAAHFADGVVWVDLSPLTDARQAPLAVASAFGLTQVDASTAPDELARLLHSRQVLLMLDTCEHVLDEVAPLVSHLLERCPVLQVLATSRAPLHVRGELLAPVAPWSLPADQLPRWAEIAPNPAVTLFVERTQAVLPAFTLTAELAGEVVEICRQLDGMPLAIELAAARMAVHTPATLVTDLAHALAAAGPRHRDLPARQQTLEATIAWSYALLDPASQALFRRLAVFAGGFSLGAASYLMRASAGDEPAANSAWPPLTELVEQSLVHRIEGAIEPRFAMLDTVRAFALARLHEAGEQAAAAGLHAACFVHLFTPAPDTRRVRKSMEGLKPLAVTDRANIRAALATLVAGRRAHEVLRLAIAYCVGTRPNPREVLPLIEWSLANAPDVPDEDRGVALAEMAFLHSAQSRYDEARAFANASLELGRRLGNLEVIASALDVSGIIALNQHRYAPAKDAFSEAIPYWRLLGDRGYEAADLQLLAGAEHGLGDESAALEHALTSLTLFRELRLWVGAATGLARIGRLMRDLGFDRAACISYRETLELCASGVERPVLVQAYGGLAEIASRHGQAEIAAALLGAIDEIALDIGATRLPTAGVNYDRATAAASAGLGAESFATLRAQGARLRLDEAVALARLVHFPPARGDEPAPNWSQLALSAAEMDRLSTGHAPTATTEAVRGLLRRQRTTAQSIGLTDREQQVLSFLGQRLTDAEIAERLFISRRTASNHVANIINKLDAANRRDAAAIAVRLALI